MMATNECACYSTLASVSFIERQLSETTKHGIMPGWYGTCRLCGRCGFQPTRAECERAFIRGDRGAER